MRAEGSILLTAIFCLASIAVFADEPGKVRISDKRDTDETGRKGNSHAPAPFWTLNLAEMQIPDAAVTGMLCGQKFALGEAYFEDDGKECALILWEGKRLGHKNRRISIPFPRKQSQERSERIFRIEPKDQFEDHQITINVYLPLADKNGTETKSHASKFAMLLQLGKLQEGAITGKVYLCLPDDDRSFVAGTFRVGGPGTQQLTQSEIYGRIEYPAVKHDFYVYLGCLGKNQNGRWEESGVGWDLQDAVTGSFSTIKTSEFAPRESMLICNSSGDLTHKHINRPAGKHLVYLTGASPKIPKDRYYLDQQRGEGFLDWKWVDLQDDATKAEVNLSVDPSKLGTLQVAVSGDEAARPANRYVTYLPLDPNGHLPFPEAIAIDPQKYGAEVKNGKAVIHHLREGEYQVACGATTAEVSIKAGKTTTVTLQVR